MKYEFPWKEGKTKTPSRTAPLETVEVEYHGHTIRFIPTNMRAPFSGRQMTAVECVTCGKILSQGTTLPKLKAVKHWDQLAKKDDEADRLWSADAMEAYISARDACEKKGDL